MLPCEIFRFPPSQGRAVFSLAEQEYQYSLPNIVCEHPGPDIGAPSTRRASAHMLSYLPRHGTYGLVIESFKLRR